MCSINQQQWVTFSSFILHALRQFWGGCQTMSLMWFLGRTLKTLYILRSVTYALSTVTTDTNISNFAKFENWASLLMMFDASGTQACIQLFLTTKTEHTQWRYLTCLFHSTRPTSYLPGLTDIAYIWIYWNQTMCALELLNDPFSEVVRG